jgi:cation diffusion facilitator CzcD-associated flavoprotein CzcO
MERKMLENTTLTRTDAQEAVDAAVSWVHDFDVAMATGTGIEALFNAAEAHWRDVVSFTADLRTFSGTGEEISVELSSRRQQAGIRNVRLAPDRVGPRWVNRAGHDCIEAIFEFEVIDGTGTGVVRLIPSADGSFVARTLFTRLEDLKARPELRGALRPRGQADSSKFGGPNWKDRREISKSYTDRDPEVLIVGGGQAGITLAARLGVMGLDALVVDTHERPGDNWRKRYHALTLHNAVWLNDFPYMPFPDTWPVFVPKDKLAGWFESYVDAMEINFWGATTFQGGDYDSDSGRWTARLTASDGTVKTLRPRHIVVATGESGIPFVPHFEGLDLFAGDVLHSSQYQDSARYAGKNVVIIGTGNSAHDVAQDLEANGAKVTLVQRSSTTVVSVDPSAALQDASYLTAPTMDDSDLISMATPYPDQVVALQKLTEDMQVLDAELIAALNAKGFKTDYGEDGTGQAMKYLRRGGGYYLNVGASDLIIEGKITLRQFADFDSFVPEGLRFKDGSVVPADLVVLGTGFQSQQEAARNFFGNDVAEAVGPIWGHDDEGEIRATWRPTAQPGLWFNSGNYQLCRIYSKVLAVQLARAIDAAL